jgi:hypothetical protein
MMLRHFAPGTYEKGSYKSGEVSEIVFRGTAQPASGKALEMLSEGKRNTETITVFAPKSLSFTTADSETQRSGDIIVYKERLYEVQIARDFSSGLLPHWEILASRIKEGET